METSSWFSLFASGSVEALKWALEQYDPNIQVCLYLNTKLQAKLAIKVEDPLNFSDEPVWLFHTAILCGKTDIIREFLNCPKVDVTVLVSKN